MLGQLQRSHRTRGIVSKYRDPTFCVTHWRGTTVGGSVVCYPALRGLGLTPTSNVEQEIGSALCSFLSWQQRTTKRLDFQRTSDFERLLAICRRHSVNYCSYSIFG